MSFKIIFTSMLSAIYFFGLFPFSLSAAAVEITETHELKFIAKYRPFPESQYPRHGDPVVWRPDRLSFENKQLDLNTICIRGTDETICSGTIENFEMALYRGILVQISGFGSSLSLELELDGKPYLKSSLEIISTDSWEGVTYLKRIESDSGNFSWNPNLESFNIEDAPEIGGVVVNRKDSGISLRVVCVDRHYGKCRKIVFVETENGKRTPLSGVLDLSSLARVRKEKVDYVVNWFLPVTSAMDMCVLVFLPISLPVDIALLPFNVPVALIKKFRGRKAFRVLADLSQSRTIKVDWTNYEQVKEIIGSFK